jgi:hypothetical protein
MKRFWRLVWLHHQAVPIRWNISAAIAGLILGSETLIFLLPPLPPAPFSLAYFRMFLHHLGDFEMIFLMAVLLIPLFLMTAGFQDLGGKVYSLTLPVSRSQYFWARLVYSILPISAVAVPYLILLFVVRIDPLENYISYKVFDTLVTHLISYLFLVFIFVTFLIAGWFIRRGEIALLVTLVISAGLGAVEVIATSSPTGLVLTQLFFLISAVLFARWLIVKADVGQEGT